MEAVWKHPGHNHILQITSLNDQRLHHGGGPPPSVPQETNELVRQLMEEGGFYNLQRGGAEWSNVLAVQFIAAMRQPGAGANDIPARLKRHFAAFNVSLPADLSIEHIYRQIVPRGLRAQGSGLRAVKATDRQCIRGCAMRHMLVASPLVPPTYSNAKSGVRPLSVTGHFCSEGGFSAEVQQLATQLPALTRRLWAATKARMLPTPASAPLIWMQHHRPSSSPALWTFVSLCFVVYFDGK